MLKIYHAPRTRGFRVIWLCEELDIPYEINPVDFSPAYRATPEWRKISPVGKLPVMTDGALTMYESGAMVQYVLDKYGDNRLQPARGTAEHATYLQWSWFAEATFARPLGEIVNHKRMFAKNPSQEIIDEMKDRARQCAQAVANAVDGKTWILGDEFSAADIMMGYTLRLYGLLMDEALPDHAESYWARLSARDAFKTGQAADMNTGK
jgi:glutathione S-transferase